MKQFIAPDLDSEFPFLRYRAIALYTQFGMFDWPDKDHLKAVMEKIVHMFVHDDELPVRLSAGLSLQFLLMIEDKHENPIGKDILQPFLGDILSAYIKVYLRKHLPRHTGWRLSFPHQPLILELLRI